MEENNRGLPPMPPAPPEVSQPEAQVPVNLAPLIKVRATRAGFYENFRVKAGREFSVKGVGQLGDWMECLDPELEKTHRLKMKQKRQRPVD